MYVKMYFNMQLNMYDELLSKQISIFRWEEVPLWQACAIRQQFSKPFCRNTAQLLISILIASTYKAIPFMKRESISDICFENWRYQGDVWLGAHGRASLCVTKVCSAGLLHHCPHGKRRPSQNERWAPRLIPSKLAFNLLVLTPILQPSKYWVF